LTLIVMAVAGCLAFSGFGARWLRADDAPAKKPNGDAVRVACVGDSITYGAGIPDREHNSYPAQLQNLLGDGYQVRNFGVSGATLLKRGDKPYWKEKAFDEAKAFNPNIVIIKLGTNDSKPQNWRHKDEFLADAKDLVAALQALDSKPKVYVCRPVPAFPGNFGIRDQVIHEEIVPLLDKAAKAKDAKEIDLYKALSGHADLFPDKVHPNAEGAKLMAETIAMNLVEKKEAAKGK
jgi:lysophospholipase L1-like esterase